MQIKKSISPKAIKLLWGKSHNRCAICKTVLIKQKKEGSPYLVGEMAHIEGGKSVHPELLIHDNTIFNGIDKRQIAKALELAAKEAASTGFQYIVTLNSDQVPYNDFKEGFKDEFENAVVLKLTDAS